MNKQTFDKILDKKELRGIPKEFVTKIVSEIVSENEELYSKLEQKEFNEKSKEFKEFKKRIRQKLRVLYGVFQSNPLSKKQKENLLKKIKKAKEENNKEDEEKIVTKIILSHLSTRERKKYFYQVYKQITEHTGKLNSVADIACGYNPFSYPYWNKKIKYLASDITKEDMDFVQEYFYINKIDGTTLAGDLTDEKFQDKLIQKIKNYDVCLLFKALDSLESLKKGSSTILLQKIPCKNIIISFPTKSISGKNQIKSKRKWFLKALKLKNLLGWSVFEFEYGLEIYYHLIKN